MLKRRYFIAAMLVCVEAGSGFTADITVIKPMVSENTLVGEYAQPEWTTHRRFPTTRIYVQQPPGGWGLSQWWRMDDSKGENPRHRFRSELEVGLPHRFQLDLYEDTIITRDRTFYHQDVAAELRYALADWGDMPLNPTLYYEWKFVNADLGPDKYEAKLLLGDALGPDWHYGVNLIYEQEVAESRETEYSASQAIAYTVRDRKFSLGAELKEAAVTEKGARGDPSTEFSAGPSFQYRPTADSHVDFVALFGLSNDAADIETFLVFAYDFGTAGPAHTFHAPVTTHGE